MKRIVIIMAAMCCIIGINAKDLKTVVLKVTPELHCSDCESKIKGNIRYVKGVKSIETSIEQQTVTVTFDAEKTKCEDLKSAFKKLGYDIAPAGQGCAGHAAHCGNCPGHAKEQAAQCAGNCGNHKDCKQAASACCKDAAKTACKEGCKDGKHECKGNCKESGKDCCKSAGKADAAKTCKDGCKDCKKDTKK